MKLLLVLLLAVNVVYAKDKKDKSEVIFSKHVEYNRAWNIEKTGNIYVFTENYDLCPTEVIAKGELSVVLKALHERSIKFGKILAEKERLGL